MTSAEVLILVLKKSSSKAMLAHCSTEIRTCLSSAYSWSLFKNTLLGPVVDSIPIYPNKLCCFYKVVYTSKALLGMEIGTYCKLTLILLDNYLKAPIEALGSVESGCNISKISPSL